MNELCLHPQVYNTGGSDSLLRMLEDVWVRGLTPGQGTICLVSGFANYNGGVRFYDVFERHVAAGGHAWAVIGGSTRQALSSRQAAAALLESGVEVHVVNRKRILHAKCYGIQNADGERLVVSSGNFTGPGMSQNVEMSLMLDSETTQKLGFSWNDLQQQILAQQWQISKLSSDKSDPTWRLLYDERPGAVTMDETEEVTLLITLGHADTVRINAARGSDEARGTQYFWLSRDCFGFFPPLTIPNERGTKRTFSCIVTMEYVDLKEVDDECRVTFEAENNLDFRLGTAKLRYTGVAGDGDMAAISRIGDASYQLRIVRTGTPEFKRLAPFAPTFIGHQGKQYGFIANEDFESLMGLKLPRINTAKATAARARPPEL